MDDRTERPTIGEVVDALDAYQRLTLGVALYIINGWDVPADLLDQARTAHRAWERLSDAHHRVTP